MEKNNVRENGKEKQRKSFFSTKQIALGAMFLAICVASQFFKGQPPLNIVTGSIINCMLLCTTFFVGLPMGVILGIITPLTSFFITGTPAFPILIPGIMAGNIILVLVAGILGIRKPGKTRLVISLIAGVLSKFLLMWVIFTYSLIPMVANGLSAKQADAVVPTLTFNFTVMQLITATIGAFILFMVYSAVEKISKSHENPVLDEVDAAQDTENREDE